MLNAVSVEVSDELLHDLKRLVVEELNLKGRSPESLDATAPLFGPEGLGLDSLDALQLAVGVEERFGVRIPEGDEARPVFASLTALASFVVKARGG